MTHKQAAPLCKTPNAPLIAEKPLLPPLKTRMQINRENARHSTGPKSPEGKLASRQNSTTHGLRTQVALPREIMEEMAGHFWQLANAYKPTNAIAVNSILELTMCAWKNRRLFEQYAVNNARSKQTVTQSRNSKKQRTAHHWFQKLPIDPSKALIKLEESTEGLTLLIESAQTLLVELMKPDGTGFWTVNQLHLALALMGVRPTEVWNAPALRSFWSSWMAIHPHPATCVDQCNNHTSVEREYHERISEAINNRPQPDQARTLLEDEIQKRVSSWTANYPSLEEDELALEPLDKMSAGWPTGRDSNQHLLHLRYVSSNDRKTRELQALLLTFPNLDNPSDWQFDHTMLPSDWRSVLMTSNEESAHDQAIHQIYDPPPQLQESIEQSIFRNAASAQNSEPYPIHQNTVEPLALSSPMAALGTVLASSSSYDSGAKSLRDELMKEYHENRKIRELESLSIANPILVKDPEMTMVKPLESQPVSEVPSQIKAQARVRRLRNDQPRPPAPSKKPSERRNKSLSKDLQSPRPSPPLPPLSLRPITSV